NRYRVLAGRRDTPTYTNVTATAAMPRYLLVYSVEFCPLCRKRRSLTFGRSTDRSPLTPQCLVSLCRRMDFARSRPDTGRGGRGTGAALASVQQTRPPAARTTGT